MKIDHILVATDLSTDALRACAPVAGLARNSGARMTLVHVVETIQGTPHGAPFAPPIDAPDAGEQVHEARPRLEEQGAAFASDVPLTLDLIAGGDAARSIVDYATSHEVDLIALSTHGRTGFRHLALGSVAEAVIRHSPLPVLVFPRPKD